MAKKIIAVVGATGSQGGGLVRAILADPSGEFTARALTRNIDSEKAKALAKLGAEVVETDVDDVRKLTLAVREGLEAVESGLHLVWRRRYECCSADRSALFHLA